MPAVDSCSNPCKDGLCETALFDFSHPRLQLCARRLAGPGLTARDRALAIHSFVRLMPLSVAPQPATQALASAVLRAERGDAQSKGVLFVALCRAAGVPARLQMLHLRSDPLRALRGGHQHAAKHPVAQVCLEGRWLSTDAYLLDPLLFGLARRRQTLEGLDGWGLRPDVPPLWDGRDDCLQLFMPSDLLHAPDTACEPDPVDAANASTPAGALLARLRAMLLPGAHLERRLRHLRRAPPATARRPARV